MTGKEAIRAVLTSTQGLVGWYVSDLSDQDLLVRPVPGANHIAWQLGHITSAEVSLVREVLPEANYPELPAGFTQVHDNKNAHAESSAGFLTKAQYLELFQKVREATLAAVDRLTDADLDKPNTGRLAAFAPTLGALLILVSNHTLMHLGQFTVVRRKLGKPILF
ncbi:MAG: DinB family protein [Gemmataceae bacterium]|nr:DinB family protein [Gemmataceae bacterium]MDW8265078.1 DinB family protein [Gemmataceae bacterium]